MSDGVLDASALIALMLDEPGADKVAAFLPGALMSAVNVAEVVAKFIDRDVTSAATVYGVFDELGIEIVPFDGDQALVCGGLRWATREAGLSLGDRACIALGKARGLPVVTADKAWTRVAESALIHVVVVRE